MEGPDFERRRLLEAGGAGLLALSVARCTTRAGVQSSVSPRFALEPVDATEGRIIRTTVGLRPFRPSGFVVRAESLEGKTLIHNYGHGGAGHSLAWGTGHLCADLAIEQETRRAAVLGCGTVGLTAARQLQRRGFSVTIYTEATPPDTTSNMSFAGFTPVSGLIESNRRTAAWDSQFTRAAEVSYAELQRLAGREYGISWIPTYSFSNTRPGPPRSNGPFPLPPQPHGVVLEPGQHPFPSTFATLRPTIRIEPSIYLDALMRDFVAFGGRIVVRRFENTRDVAQLYERVIVNCTGLGARDLFGDDELTPVKGQLVVVVPQPGVNYSTRGGVPGTNSGGFLHMMPRKDGIVMGGTAEDGVWDLEPNQDATNRILQAHDVLFSQMRFDTQVPITAQQAATANPPALESFYDLQS